MRFYKAPNEIPGPDSVVYAILDHCGGTSTISLAALATITGESIRKTTGRVTRLVKAGHVKRSHRFNQSNVYTTQDVTGTYTPIAEAELGTMDLSSVWLHARLRFAQNGKRWAWPALKILCQWSGWSRTTVLKYLSDLESRAAIAVVRNGGGHHRGNRYVTRHLRWGTTKTVPYKKTRVQKPHSYKDKYIELNTNKTETFKTDLSLSDSKRAVQEKLLGLGMRPAEAHRLLYEQHIPLEVIRTFIKQAVADKFWKGVKARDPIERKAADEYNLAGYVINSCKKLRFECKAEAKPSAKLRAFERLRQPPAKRKTPAECNTWLSQQKKLLGVA